MWGVIETIVRVLTAAMKFSQTYADWANDLLGRLKCNEVQLKMISKKNALVLLKAHKILWCLQINSDDFKCVWMSKAHSLFIEVNLSKKPKVYPNWQVTDHSLLTNVNQEWIFLSFKAWYWLCPLGRRSNRFIKVYIN